MSKTKHQIALDLIGKNRLQEALTVLSEVLEECETSDLWNDWATVKIACNQVDDARRGYERAIELNAKNTRAQFNLALILVNQGSLERGIPLLEAASARLGKAERAAAEQLLKRFQKSTLPKAANQARQDAKRILLIHEVLPHFDRSGSDMRLMQVIRRLRAQGHEVTYLARHAAEREKYTAPLKELGVTVFAGDAERLRAFGIDAASEWKFQDVLPAGKFDVAILFHWFWSGISVTEQYLDDIRRLSSSTRIIVLTDDRHGIREWRASQVSGLLADRERAMDFLAREFECYRAADLVLAISEDDRRGLLEMAPELEIDLLPMTADAANTAPELDGRKDFVFLANFDNLANRDAAAWLCQDIWPRIRKRLPEANLHLAGNRVPEHLASIEGVKILGYVSDLESTMKQFRVFLSPIRIGTGIKTKNLIALGQGLPLVTTTVGAEGMALTDGENVLVADSAGAFSNKAIEAYVNPDLWRRLATEGIRHIGMEFSTVRLDAQIKKILERVDAITPQGYDPGHRFSVNLVEEFHPRVLTEQPPESRFQLRALAYRDLAERLLEMGNPAEARQQLRHIFLYVRGQVPRNLMFAHLFSLLERCYRELNEPDAAAVCGEEAKLCLPELNPTLVPKVTKTKPSRKGQSGLAFSVIIPTYNRQAKLARCLQALAAQSLPSSEFEVIVVDDGSSDGTADLVASQSTPFRLHYLHQTNQGAGAARRSGVEHAKGEYLLLINDDTIADADVLQQHLSFQQQRSERPVAVLGSFEYEAKARSRALTWFLNTDVFMFPQVGMREGVAYDAPCFVSCNLSIVREAVLRCGSFDPTFRLGEDSELGLRLGQAGYKVMYQPKARAWHDHLEMTIEELVRRANAYGPVYARLLQKHDYLSIPTQFGNLNARMTVADLEKIRALLAVRRPEVEENITALKQYDSVDFNRFFSMKLEQGTLASRTMELFRQAIPYVHWFYLLESFCEVWQIQPPPATSARQEAVRA